MQTSRIPTLDAYIATALARVGLPAPEERGSTIDITELERAVKAHDNAVLERFCDLWDDRRDRRPAFATTEIAVDDILKDAGDEWPNALRDFLGLGSYNPEPHVDPIPVLLMRYTVAEVLADKSSGAPGFAIPTLIDGRLNPFSFPTPCPRPGSDAAQHEVGRSVNLHPATTQAEYRMGMELVHSRIAYAREHIWRLGRVSRPLAGDLAILRGLHLAWLQLEADRDDFGAP